MSFVCQTLKNVIGMSPPAKTKKHLKSTTKSETSGAIQEVISSVGGTLTTAAVPSMFFQAVVWADASLWTPDEM